MVSQLVRRIKSSKFVPSASRSSWSTKTTSSPRPQLIESSSPSSARMVSLPGPPSMVSLPGPPSMVSSSLSPFRTSLPSLPNSVSLPNPPPTLSDPGPPFMVSAPLLPRMASLLPLPCILSPACEPRIVSAFAVPLQARPGWQLITSAASTAPQARRSIVPATASISVTLFPAFHLFIPISSLGIFCSFRPPGYRPAGSLCPICRFPWTSLLPFAAHGPVSLILGAGVGACAAVSGVARGAVPHLQEVGAAAAHHDVPARVAGDIVVAEAGVHGVGVSPAAQHVVSGLAPHPVQSGVADQEVVAATGVDRVVAGEGADHVVASRAAQDILAWSAADGALGVAVHRPNRDLDVGRGAVPVVVAHLVAEGVDVDEAGVGCVGHVAVEQSADPHHAAERPRGGRGIEDLERRAVEVVAWVSVVVEQVGRNVHELGRA